MNRTGRAVACLLIAAAGLTPAAAKNKTPGDANTTAAPFGAIMFSASERTMIQSYFAGGGAGRGSAKPLPPGIAKKVARGGTLPPGIAKRYLPQDLEARLPPPPLGLERVIVGTDVLLVEISTGAILDMISRALR